MFSFGNLQMSNSDFEGRVASGGAVTFSNFQIGYKLPAGGSTACSSLSTTLGDNYVHSIVSNGAVSLTSGRVNAGGCTYSSTQSISGVTFNSGCGASQVSNVFDFSGWNSYASQFSSYLASLSATGKCFGYFVRSFLLIFFFSAYY
jgi:choice-of-anchor A domain-containing protein